jgi:uncharacterized protein (TIGR04222 family)
MFDLLIQIPGPNFLIHFSIFSTVCIALGWFWLRLSDSSTSYSLPALTRFSPFEIAALRDGRKGVIQTALFSLWHKGDLSVAGKGRTAVIHRNNFERSTPLNPIEETVYQFTSMFSRDPTYFFRNKSLHKAVDIQLKSINRTLEGAHLKKTEAALTSALIIRSLVLFLILGIGLTKLFFGFYYDKPILFLVILLIIFTFIVFRVLKPTLTTRLGRRYLKKLNDHFAWVKSAPSDKLDPTLTIAIFGVTALASFTEFSSFEQAFAGTAAPGSASSGGCGGGCGGDSSSGGGGCGGGCGGCGGGD